MSQPIWILCPVVNNLDMTMTAISDFLDQSVPTRVLIINQGSDSPTREALERQAELTPDRLFIWSHEPPLPSLAAAWNRGLDYFWSTRAEMALVVNNDVRIHRYTVAGLMGVLNLRRAEPYLFVSAVAVTQEQFEAPQVLDAEGYPRDPLNPDEPLYWYNYAKREVTDKGGPDFSCYMIAKAGHEKYRFDENFIPAYCEDLDTHRRYMLGGDGDKIFSVNLPYLHYASGTLKTMDPEARAKKERQIEGSRNYYRQKWGGPVNQETFQVPFGADSFTFTDGSKTTPALQRWWQEGRPQSGHRIENNIVTGNQGGIDVR